MEVNTLLVNKKTLNSGTIIFDNSRVTKEWIKTLIELGIGFTKYVLIVDGRKYYGIKMFRFKKQFFTMCVEFKEVLTLYG